MGDKAFIFGSEYILGALGLSGYQVGRPIGQEALLPI
jgi:hypothetical protein